MAQKKSKKQTNQIDMKVEVKERIKSLLTQIKTLSENILKNLFTLGNEIHTTSVISYTYSPNTDIVYIYCNHDYSGQLLLKELKNFFLMNKVQVKGINSDMVNKMFIIEIEFGDKDIISANNKVQADFKSIKPTELEDNSINHRIDNRYL